LKVKKVLILLTTSVFLLLAACSNDEASTKDVEIDKEAAENVNKTGMPVVKDSISLNIFTGKSLTNVNADWNDIMIWNKYEEMTNVDVNWTQVPGDSLAEKRNLALAGGELPDVFYAASIPNSDLLKYGGQGTFLPLNDLIDEYAPNFKTILDEHPEIRKAITFPDGNIYSLPILYDPEFTSLLMNATPWVNQKWLDQLGMEMPETTDEFYEYLKAVKETDLNGNGELDEVPFGSYRMSYLVRWLKGSYGIGNRVVSYIDLDPETQDVRFYPTTDRYKEMLQYINKLWSEGLIDQNIYSIKFNEFLTKAGEGVLGSTIWYTPSKEFGEAGKDYVGGIALKGPHGDQIYADVSNPMASNGRFVITNKNPNPAATMRWIDYFYGDEGAKLFYMGIEGETYEKTADGKLKYLDKITDNPDGSTMNEQLVKYLAWVGSSAPSIIKQEYFQGTEASPDAIKAGEKLKPYFTEEVWPAFTYTKEENQDMIALSGDIQKYVDEMTDKFITGDVPFTEWDKYVDTLKGMGLEQYMEIQRAAYKRYAGK
jgi:putative aldouronate transport system substrate-binding protein